MRVWITKYALTRGIQEVEASFDESAPDMVSYLIGSGTTFRSYAHGKDWHWSMNEAYKRACEMRESKIKSLEKQLQKMKSLEFKVIIT